MRLSASCLKADDPLEVDVSWGTTDVLDVVYQAQLALVDGDGAVAQVEEYTPLAEWPTDRWPENTIVWSYFVLETLPSLAAGRYEMILSLISSNSQDLKSEGRSVQVGEIEVREDRCQFDVPPGLTETDATYGNRLRLRGYSVDALSGNVEIILFWQSIRRMDTNYKIFVHVFEPGTGIPVAQDDSMPDRNDFPTRFWPAGATLLDRFTIPLIDAPPGDYGIAVGVYDPLSMDRLPVVNGKGERQPDGRFVFPDQSVRIEDFADE